MCTCVYHVRVHVWERVHVGVCVCVYCSCECASVRGYLPCVGMSLHVSVCKNINSSDFNSNEIEVGRVECKEN